MKNYLLRIERLICKVFFSLSSITPVNEANTGTGNIAVCRLKVRLVQDSDLLRKEHLQPGQHRFSQP